MKTTQGSQSPASPTSPSLWLALTAATVSFCIASSQIVFGVLIGLASFLLATQYASNNRYVSNFLRPIFIFASYTAFLISFWPNSPFDYHGTPLLLILVVAGIAALNKKSFGGSRGFVSILAVAFLLFIRNITQLHDFVAPFPDLAKAVAFIALMEVGLGLSYRHIRENLHPEFVFGLLIAIIASFSIDSLLLAFLIVAFPIASFLSSNHQWAKEANEHVRELTFALPIEKLSRRRLRFLPTLLLLPLLLAAPLYLATLRLPFWADSLPRDAPQIAKVIADRADRISIASDIEDDAVEGLAKRVIDKTFLEEKARNLVQTLRREEKKPQENPASTFSYDSRQTNSSTQRRNIERPQNARPTDYGLAQLAPRETAYEGKAVSNSQLQANDAAEPVSRTSSARTLPQAPRAGLGQTYPEALINQAIDSSAASSNPPSIAKSNGGQSAQTNPSTASTNRQDAQSLTRDNSDFEQFLETFERPEQAISRVLNLEANNVSALLSEEPLVIVTLNSVSRNNRPRRLYLRNTVLNTDSATYFSEQSLENNSLEIETANNATAVLPDFQQSKSRGSEITITASLDRNPTLPFPESFSRIQVLNTESIDIIPSKRIGIASQSDRPVSYVISDADLEVSDRERLAAKILPTTRKEALDLPLGSEDRDYLAALARRVGGTQTPPRLFAHRFANYFANRHPYSYFVDIPEGQEHAVVRWLKNESPGLCTNYAAAFTLLARSRGIPTRIIGGYASEEYDEKSNRYVMRQKNAHAWVEYLDESNRWILFDPTPGISEAEITRVESLRQSPENFSLTHLLSAERLNLEKSKGKQTRANAYSNSDYDEAKVPTQSFENKQPQQRAEPEQVPSRTLAPRLSDNVEGTLLDTPQTRTRSATAGHRQNEVPQNPASSPDTIGAKKRNQNLELDSPKRENTESSSNEISSGSSQAQDSKALPWILSLLLFALGIPALAYAHKSRRQDGKAFSQQVQLRLKAGQVLNRLENLIRERKLEGDPVWSETRDALTAQRYGRETNPLLVQDLTIKVALLEKGAQSPT